MKVIIAASQTGGHINPGIAIANKIKEENKDAEIIFIGTKRGLENDLVPRAGYKLRTIEAYGIVRKISIDNFKKMLKTLKGYGEAKKILKEEKPDIVIGTGGFICGPVLLAAAKQKIPTMLHESNAFPGVTVKLLAKKVDTILIGFEDAKAKIHDAKNVVLTGTPTKFKEIQYSDKDKEEFLKENNLQKDKTLILVFGGSQGARPINNALEEIIEKNLNKIVEEAPIPNIRIKMGIYENIDKSLQIPIICDRALIAVKSISKDFKTNIAFFTSEMNQRLLAQRQMENDYNRSINFRETSHICTIIICSRKSPRI